MNHRSSPLPVSGTPRNILVLEDEMFIAMLVEDVLTTDGYRVHHAARVDKALELLASNESIEAALLDINLNGEKGFPVARKLREMRIPFVFASGYGRDALSPEFSASVVLQKPYLPDALRTAIAELLA